MTEDNGIGSPNPDDEFRKCAFCYTERTCRFYPPRNLWLCTTGPSGCWRRRVTGVPVRI